MEEFEVSPQGSTADLHDANLPPVDRGRGAWGFLAASFMIEALIWGTCIKSFAMTWTLADRAPYRIHIFLRNFPGLLQYPRTIQELRRHRRGRNLRNGKSSCTNKFHTHAINQFTGNFLHAVARRFHSAAGSSPSQAVGCPSGLLDYVPRAGAELFRHQYRASRCLSGCRVRHWGESGLCAYHRLHG